jgi:hypothetical protein
LLSADERQRLQARLMELASEERLEYAIRWAQEQGYFSEDVPLALLALRYRFEKGSERLLRGEQCLKVRAPIHIWWARDTLSQHGSVPIDWRVYTTGPVWSEIVEGDHRDVVESEQVHRQIAEILTALSAGVCRYDV